MSTVALSYTAGFLDADGHIGFHKSNGAYQPSFAIVNANRSTLEFIQKVVGGSIYTRKPKNPNHSTTYCLQISRKSEISKALEGLMPYIVGKREIAELVKKFCDNRVAANPKIGMNNPPTQEDLSIVDAVKRLGSIFYKKPVRSTV